MKPETEPTWQGAVELAEKLSELIDREPVQNLYVDMMASLSVAGTVLDLAMRTYPGKVPHQLSELERLIGIAVSNLRKAAYKLDACGIPAYLRKAPKKSRTAPKPNPTPPTVH
jgi:hypothetical protein